MSQENKKQDPAADGIGGLVAFLGPVREMFGAITVLERYEIRDNLGNVYQFRPVLNARKQIEAATRVDRFWSECGESLSGMRAQAAKSVMDDASGMQALLWFLGQAAADERVLFHLQGLWEALHPKLNAAAVQAAQQEDGPDADVTVIDLFGLEAILEGLVPFFVHFGTSTIGMLQRAAPNQANPEGSSGKSSTQIQRPRFAS